MGGSSGIGLATARMAASEGPAVVIASRSMDKLEEAAASIPGQVKSFRRYPRGGLPGTVLRAVGKLDHLTTPGGEVAGAPFVELDLRAVRQSFDSKFRGQYMAAKHGAPRIRNGGTITLISGSNSQRPLPQAAVRTAVNSAVEGLARALGKELTPIRVNAVAPGFIDTPLHDHRTQGRKEVLFHAMSATLPLKHVGSAEEIAHAILHLMPIATRPATLFVDGGYAALPIDRRQTASGSGSPTWQSLSATRDGWGN